MTATILSIALLAAISSSALAQSTPASMPTEPAPPVKQKKVCRSEPSTGSFLITRTCHTKAEWIAIDQTNAADAARVLSRRTHYQDGQ